MPLLMLLLVELGLIWHEYVGLVASGLLVLTWNIAIVVRVMGAAVTWVSAKVVSVILCKGISDGSHN